MAKNFLESIGLLPKANENFDLLDTRVHELDKSEGWVFNGGMNLDGSTGIASWWLYSDSSGAIMGNAGIAGGGSIDIYSLRPSRSVMAYVKGITPGLAEVNVIQRGDQASELPSTFIARVDDPVFYTEGLQPFPEYYLGGIADYIEVYKSEEERAEALGEPIEEDNIFTPWFNDVLANPEAAGAPNARALLKARCLEVNLVTNKMTGKKFYKVEVEAPFPLTLALPADTKPKPKPGNILDGDLVLTGSTGRWYK